MVLSRCVVGEPPSAEGAGVPAGMTLRTGTVQEGVVTELVEAVHAADELQCGLVFNDEAFIPLVLDPVRLLEWEPVRLESVPAPNTEYFFGGGSTSTSSTFALFRFTTTTDSPSLIATDKGDLPAKKSSIYLKEIDR